MVWPMQSPTRQSQGHGAVLHADAPNVPGTSLAGGVVSKGTVYPPPARYLFGTPSDRATRKMAGNGTYVHRAESPESDLSAGPRIGLWMLIPTGRSKTSDTR